MSEKVREEFEEWCRDNNIQPLSALMHGQIPNQSVVLAWQAWQASRAALVVELPGAIWCSLAYHEAINDVKEALDDAGVCYK